MAQATVPLLVFHVVSAQTTVATTTNNVENLPNVIILSCRVACMRVLSLTAKANNSAIDPTSTSLPEEDEAEDEESDDECCIENAGEADVTTSRVLKAVDDSVKRAVEVLKRLQRNT